MSVPSQPSSPEGKHQTTGLDTGFAAMTIAATTAMPIATTQAELTFQHPASNPSKFTVITLCVLHKPMGGSQSNEEIPSRGSEGYHVLKVPHTMHCGFQF